MGWSECRNVVSGDICGCQHFKALSNDPFFCGSCACHKHFHVRPEDDEFTKTGNCSKIRYSVKCGCQKFLGSLKNSRLCSCCSHDLFLHSKDLPEEEEARALKRVKHQIQVHDILNADDEQSCITKTGCPLPLHMPLLPLRLCDPKQPTKPPDLETIAAEAFTGSNVESYKSKIRHHLNTTMTKFQLNEDQACVLLTVERWFSSHGMMPVHLMPELCLVHGTFGSGKSYLLVVLVVFVVDILQILNDTTTRILISAATDSAVDRILKDLLARGFHEFMRVGSYEKIAGEILRYSVHLTRHNDYNYSETIQELQQLIKTAGHSRRLGLEEELKSIRDGDMEKRREKLSGVRVVGVTCHSCTKPVLEGHNFKICFVDECSQIPEPLALLPVKNCTKLVVVGDLAKPPCVRPPCHAELIKVARQSPLYDLGLRRSMFKYKEDEEENMSVGSKRTFSCLIAEGHKPIILNKQYRCHPRLATLPSLLFYQGEVENGCRDGDRAPLLQGLPPLLFCETGSNGAEEKDSSFGFMNKYEAQLVSQIIKSLIAHGISCSRIGVIAFYKAQALLVKQVLVADNALVDLQVATVDAYEGTENDIIILSCCRTNGIGSVAYPNQLNVALTRARHHLIIVGMGMNLQKNELWKKILGSVRSTPGSFKPAAKFMTEIRASPVEETNCAAPQLEVVSLGSKSSSDFRIVDIRNDSSDGEGINKKALKSRKNQLEVGRLIEGHLCTKGLESALGAVDFSVQDFWEGYKFYCFGYYSHSEKYKRRFLGSKMGCLINHVYKERSALAGAKFDETVRLVWSMMEDYLKIRHGKDCTNLRALVEEFENIDELSATENGLSLLQLIKDDEYATERLYKHKHVHLDSTNIFEQLRQRLNQVDTNLEDLKKTSGLHNESAVSRIPDPTDRRQGEILRSKRGRPPPEIKKRGSKQSIQGGSSSRRPTGSCAHTYSESEGSSQPSFSLRF